MQSTVHKMHRSLYNLHAFKFRFRKDNDVSAQTNPRQNRFNQNFVIFARPKRERFLEIGPCFRGAYQGGGASTDKTLLKTA
jgi:hypothetical protein